MTPETFARTFTTAFARQDAAALAALLAPEASTLTLSGQLCDSRAAAETALAAEFAVLLRLARLVSGKGDCARIGPEVALLRQRFVVTAAQAEDGRELPRFPALLTVVLRAETGRWQAINLIFAALA